LENYFSKDVEYIKGFKNIIYTPILIYTATHPDRRIRETEWEKEFEKGMSEAEELLKEFRKEIRRG